MKISPPFRNPTICAPPSQLLGALMGSVFFPTAGPFRGLWALGAFWNLAPWTQHSLLKKKCENGPTLP